MFEIQSTHNKRPNCLRGYFFRDYCKEFTSYHDYLFKAVVCGSQYATKQADGKGLQTNARQMLEKSSCRLVHLISYILPVVAQTSINISLALLVGTGVEYIL